MRKISLILSAVSIFLLLALSSVSEIPQTHSDKLNNFFMESGIDSSNSIFDKGYRENRSERYIRNSFEKDAEWVREKEKEIDLQGNLYDVNRYTTEDSDGVYLENAWRLYNRTYENAREQGWLDLKKAKQDGFNNTYSVDHYVNTDYYRDDQTLNPSKPEFLMFRKNSTGSNILVGVMYMLNDVETEGKQVGGPLTKWHYHTFEEQKCYYSGYSISLTDNCPDQYYSNKSPEMLHVWFVEHPEGVFATDMAVSLREVDSGNDKMNQSEFYELY